MSVHCQLMAVTAAAYGNTQVLHSAAAILPTAATAECNNTAGCLDDLGVFQRAYICFWCHSKPSSFWFSRQHFF